MQLQDLRRFNWLTITEFNNATGSICWGGNGDWLTSCKLFLPTRYLEWAVIWHYSSSACSSQNSKIGPLLYQDYPSTRKSRIYASQIVADKIMCNKRTSKEMQPVTGWDLNAAWPNKLIHAPLGSKQLQQSWLESTDIIEEWEFSRLRILNLALLSMLSFSSLLHLTTCTSPFLMIPAVSQAPILAFQGSVVFRGGAELHIWSQNSQTCVTESDRAIHDFSGNMFGVSGASLKVDSLWANCACTMLLLHANVDGTKRVPQAWLLHTIRNPICEWTSPITNMLVYESQEKISFHVHDYAVSIFARNSQMYPQNHPQRLRESEKNRFGANHASVLTMYPWETHTFAWYGGEIPQPNKHVHKLVNP